MNNKQRKNLSQITGYNQQTTMQRKTQWLVAYDQRERFLADLRKQGLKGSDYSDKVVEYDKNSMEVFV